MAQEGEIVQITYCFILKISKNNVTLMCISIVIFLSIHKFPGGATVIKIMGKTSGEAAEVVYQWYFVC